MTQYSRENIDRVVFLSDIHLGLRNASIEWIENITSYFDNFFIPLIKKYKKSKETVALVIAGDFFDNRQHIDINVMNIGSQIMYKLSKEVEVFILVGNHDIYKKKDTDITSLRLFDMFDNVNVVYNVSQLLLKGDKKMTLVPWVGDHKAETNLLAKHKNDDFIIMHTDIAGLNFDNGREIIDGANISVVETGKIYSGHIHKRQENDKVVYLGSPYQLRRSDIGNNKGVYSIKFVEKGSSYTTRQEFVANEYSPKFLRIRISDILNLPIGNIKEIVENNYVDIIIKKKHMNEINIAKLMEAMDLCNTKKIEVILDKFDNELAQQETIEVSNDLTITDIFNEKLNKFELTDEAKETLKEMNNKYLALAIEALGGEL
jgi:DNA repair exonuclease SbcCD nuclease subunit